MLRVPWCVATRCAAFGCAAIAIAGGASLATQSAYAVTCAADIGTITTTPFTCDVTVDGGSGLFLDTINFEVDPLNPIVTITSVVENIQFFSIPIFENIGDTEYITDDDGQHHDVDLSLFAGQVAGADYHVHPQGLKTAAVDRYTLTFVATKLGVTVTPTSGLSTSEAGQTTQFLVSLSTAPSQQVTIAVSSSDTSEGTASPSSLSFAAGEQGPLTVTVTGVGDAVVDGNQPYTVVLGAAQSADTRFNGIDPEDVSVTNLDLDGKILVSAISGQITEAGAQGSFTVHLASAPASDVTVALTVDKPGEAQANPVSLTFTTADGTTPQTVTVAGQDDTVTDGNQAFTVSLAASSADPVFHGTAATVSGVNIDNDIPGIVIEPAAGLVTTETGGTANFTVRLATVPAADVSVAMSVSDATEATLMPAQLIFTPANALTPQTVILTGQPDDNVDGDVVYQAQFVPAVSSDPNYQGLTALPVSAVNEDADTSQAGATSGNFGGCTLVARHGQSPRHGFEWGLLLCGLAAARLVARARLRRYATFRRY